MRHALWCGGTCTTHDGRWRCTEGVHTVWTGLVSTVGGSDSRPHDDLRGRTGLAYSELGRARSLSLMRRKGSGWGVRGFDICWSGQHELGNRPTILGMTDEGKDAMVFEKL